MPNIFVLCFHVFPILARKCQKAWKMASLGNLLCGKCGSSYTQEPSAHWALGPLTFQLGFVKDLETQMSSSRYQNRLSWRTGAT